MLIFLCILVLSGCKKEQEKPSDVFKEYLADWQQKNFTGMYGKIDSKSQAEITMEEFVQRYGKIYDGMEVSQVSVTPLEVKDHEKGITEMEFKYILKMNTLAGPLQFQHQMKLLKTKIDKETKWRILWEPSLILPQMADGDKVRVQRIKAERGEILDRNGSGLAANGTALQIGIIPGELGGAGEDTKAKLAEMLNMSTDDINKKLSASWVKPNLFVPIAIVAEDVVDNFRDISGIDFQEKKIRVYPYAEAAAHLTGYIGEISAEQLEKRKEQGYMKGDLIGKSGLEQVFEDELRGKNGVRIFITDTDGKEKAIVAETEAVAGKTIKLTVDANLQDIIYNELQKDAGSAAAIQPVSGEILGLVSSPSYDPNAFQRGMTNEQFDQWNNHPQKPFLNRFSRGYAPGSSFKIVTAAIGLDTKTLNPAQEKSISGLTWAKDKSWGSYYVKRVHEINPVNLRNALVYSDNIYFAQAALQIGKETFEKETFNFGMGEEIPIPYPLKKSQLSNNGIKNEIQLADTGYGQAEIMVTSLHMALIFSALVNEGDIVYPLLTEEDGLTRLAHFDPWKEKAMSPETASMLKNELVQVVSSPNGTGRGAYIPGSSIAGKTGTAELKQSKEENNSTENGWFVGFDAADPQLLVSMMIEDVKQRGGSGYVAPKVKSIIQQDVENRYRGH